jgi:hypothetical protein
MPPAQAWQLLAKTFALTELLILRDRLPKDFQPTDAIALCEGAISTHERSVLSFLLHVWNRYDFPFELSEVAMWGPDHQRAFSNWVNGETLGKPCRYF